MLTLLLIFKLLFISSFSKEVIHINTRQLSNSLCNHSNCPNQQGYCRADRCVCFEGYLTFHENSEDDEIFCNYNQKRVMTALLLESFGLFGFVHLYCGRIFIGIIKLVMFYVIICYGTQFVIQFMKESTDYEITYYIKIIISLMCLGTPLVWHFVDLYNFSTNNYLDGNGMELLD